MRSGARVRDLRRDLLRRPRRAARQRRRRGLRRRRRQPELGPDLRGPGRVRAAARGEALRRVGPLRRRRLPRRRDPRRDRATTTTSARRPPAGSRRSQLDDRRPCAFGVITAENMDQALARAGGDKRDQGRNAAATPCCGWRALSRAQLSAASRPRYHRRARWPRSVTAAARAPRSGTREATRWSRPAGASTRTSRRSGSTTAGTPRRVYVCTRCLKANKVTKAA